MEQVPDPAHDGELHGDCFGGIERVFEMHGGAGGDDVGPVRGFGVIAHERCLCVGAALNELAFLLLGNPAFGFSPCLGGVEVKLTCAELVELYLEDSPPQTFEPHAEEDPVLWAQ